MDRFPPEEFLGIFFWLPVARLTETFALPPRVIRFGRSLLTYLNDGWENWLRPLGVDRVGLPVAMSEKCRHQTAHGSRPENLIDHGPPILTSPPRRRIGNPIFSNRSGCNLLGQLFTGGTDMKHQVHVATESGIVSTEAVMQIRRLITELARNVDALDAAKNRPPADVDNPDLRRRNLMVTIASLEDRLDCIEKVRSREYGAHANLTVPRAHVARLH